MPREHLRNSRAAGHRRPSPQTAQTFKNIFNAIVEG
jgi:hypothetical protein